MISVDTNVVLRLIVNDDATRADAASRLLAENAVFITRTVLLATHWVLTSHLRFTEATATERIADVIRCNGVEVEGGADTYSGVRAALDGLGFEDALHLFGTPDQVPFASFDRTLRSRASRPSLPRTVINP
jgi:predicted nucleic-acid-binding protein